MALPRPFPPSPSPPSPARGSPHRRPRRHRGRRTRRSGGAAVAAVVAAAAAAAAAVGLAWASVAAARILLFPPPVNGEYSQLSRLCWLPCHLPEDRRGGSGGCGGGGGGSDGGSSGSGGGGGGDGGEDGSSAAAPAMREAPPDVTMVEGRDAEDSLLTIEAVARAIHEASPSAAKRVGAHVRVTPAYGEDIPCPEAGGRAAGGVRATAVDAQLLEAMSLRRNSVGGALYRQTG